MNSAKSKILIFSSSYPPVVGGLQTVAHNVAKQLLKRGHDVRVVTNRYPVDLAPHETIEGVLVDRVLLLPASTDYLKRQRPDLFLAALFYGPKSHWRLTKLFREFRPDVVNVHFPDSQINAVLKLRQRFDFRLVVSLHGDDVERFSNGARGNGSRNNLPALRAILKSADAVTAVSRDLLDKAVKVEPAIKEKGYVIHNGIDLSRFTETARHDHPRPYWLAVGRLVRKKGFDLLIDAFARCDAQYHADLIIAGSGEERDALLRQVEGLGLNEKVHFFGAASPEEVVRLMNGSIGVVVPSRQEPFGIVALEALAAGKPLVATNVDGLGELLAPLVDTPVGANNEDRLAVVTPSPESIAAGLKRVASTNGGPPRADYALPKKFEWQSVTAAYERVLTES